MRHGATVAALLLGLLCFGCDADTIEPTSGLDGRVLKAPTCPGPERQGEGEACQAPLQAVFVVYDAYGKTVTTFETDEDGQFSVSLPPGTYRVVPALDDPILSRQEKEVEVVPDEFTTLTLVYDTGIR